MSSVGIKALVLHFIEEVNKGEAAAMKAIDELFTPDFVFHSATGEDMYLEDFKKHLSESFRAFPDLHFTLDDMVAEGSKVASRFTMSGTHKGGFTGIPPPQIRSFRFGRSTSSGLLTTSPWKNGRDTTRWE